MSLILAIEPDQRQAAQLADLIRERLNADLVHARTTEGALMALAGIGDRVPDLVLVPSLLSAQEDAAIAGALRVIATAANVRMLTIPVLAGPAQPPQQQGVFAKLRGRKAKKAPGGCDPAVFADQIAAYLAEAAAERRAREAEADLMDLPAAIAPGRDVTPPQREPVPSPTATPVFEDLPAGTSEPVLETVIEPTPIRYAPIVLAPPPRQTSEAPPSIWLTPPTAPVVAPDVEVTFRQPLAATAAVHEPTTVDESAEPVVAATVDTFEDEEARVLEQPRQDEPRPLIASDATTQVVATNPLPEVDDPDDQLPMLAIEELLEAIALDEQPSSPDIPTEEVPRHIEQPEAVIALERESQSAAIDEGAVVVAIPESDEASEAAPGPETVVELTPVAPRRRRKNRRAKKSESDRFDIDVLLAPLLSELAAKRASSDQRNQSVVSHSEEALPDTVIPAPEVISTASMSVSAPDSTPLPSAVAGPQPFAELHDTDATSVDHQVLHAAADAYGVHPAVARSDDTPIQQPLTPVNVVAVKAASDGLRSDEAPSDEDSPDKEASDEEPSDEDAIGEASPIDTTAVAVAVTSALPIDVVPVGVMSEDVPATDVMPADPAPLDVPSRVAMSAEAVPAQSVPVEIALVDPTPIEIAPLAAIPVAPTRTAPAPIASTPVAAAPVAAVPVAPAPGAPAPTFDGVAAEAEVDPMFFADEVHDGRQDPAPHDRPAWVELIESLRKDIERLKAERTQPVAAPAPAPSASPVVEAPPRVGRVLSIAAARAPGQAKVTPTSKVRNATPRVKGPKPIQDQWGLFDPDQCGFAALRAKLDEISTREEVPV